MKALALPLLLPLALAALACIDKNETAKAIQLVQEENSPRPDTMPVMRNRELPFRYPPALFASKVQGNVVLRIHIDSTGAVWPESTAVVQSSGYAGLDSAAVAGSRELHFTPAKKGSAAVGVTLQLPVYFRHPAGRPLPGDTVLTHAPTKAP